MEIKTLTNFWDKGYLKSLKTWNNSKRLIFCLILIFSIKTGIAQNDSLTNSLPTIYLIPGQGADARLFDSLKLDKRFTIQNIHWVTPPKHTSMTEYAQLLAEQINTDQPFILIGTSLGGMIATEMCDFLHPKKAIIISSAKTQNELPKRYTFQRNFGLYKAFPPIVIRGGAKIMQPLVEPDRNKNKATFKAMLRQKDPLFLKRTVHMIVNWERTSHCTDIIHIHGNKDKTIPIKNVQYDFLIENGSHMMTLTRADEVSTIINQVLKSTYPNSN